MLHRHNQCQHIGMHFAARCDREAGVSLSGKGALMPCREHLHRTFWLVIGPFLPRQHLNRLVLLFKMSWNRGMQLDRLRELLRIM